MITQTALRTRLPRASTTASVASVNNNESTEAVAASAHPAPGVSKERLLQVVQQIEFFDTQRLFTGTLAVDGRLSFVGPLVVHNLRCLHPLTMSHRRCAQNCPYVQSVISLSPKWLETGLITDPATAKNSQQRCSLRPSVCCSICFHMIVCMLAGRSHRYSLTQ